MFEILRDLFFAQVSKYFLNNLRHEIFAHKILLIVQEVVQTVFSETPFLPPRQGEVWKHWELRQGPESERHGGVGSSGVERHDVVKNGTEDEMVRVRLCDCVTVFDYLRPTTRAEVKRRGVRPPKSPLSLTKLGSV